MRSIHHSQAIGDMLTLKLDKNAHHRVAWGPELVPIGCPNCNSVALPLVLFGEEVQADRAIVHTGVLDTSQHGHFGRAPD